MSFVHLMQKWFWSILPGRISLCAVFQAETSGVHVRGHRDEFIASKQQNRVSERMMHQRNDSECIFVQNIRF